MHRLTLKKISIAKIAIVTNKVTAFYVTIKLTDGHLEDFFYLPINIFNAKIILNSFCNVIIQLHS